GLRLPRLLARVLQRPAARGSQQGALGAGLAPDPGPAQGPPLRGSGPAVPGSGWPGDPADSRTPVAQTPADVRRLAAAALSFAEVAAARLGCRARPRPRTRATQ